MRDPIGPVPKAYVVHRVAETWLVLNRACAAELVQLRLADRGVREKLFASAPRRGRGATPVLQITPTLRGVARLYRHGGLLGRLLGTLYWGPRRALAELEVTSRAAESGAPVPEVLALVSWPVLGPLWSSLIVTREESGARDLCQALVEARNTASRRSILARTAAAIRRLHDAGVDHRDLQVANILLVGQGAAERVVVIDLDRAVFHGPGMLSPSRRAANLGRLFRSGVKRGLWGDTLGRIDGLRFAAGYLRRNRDLRNALRPYLRREAAKLAVHRVGYA